jgi:hypothetical protein
VRVWSSGVEIDSFDFLKFVLHSLGAFGDIICFEAVLRVPHKVVFLLIVVFELDAAGDSASSSAFCLGSYFP